METPSADGLLQYGLELVLQKLEHIDHKLLKLQIELNELRERTASNKDSHDKKFTAILTAINRLEDHMTKDIGRNMSVLQDQSMLILEQQTTCASHEQIREKLINCTLKNNEGEGGQHKEGTRISLSSLYKSRTLNIGTPTTLPSKLSSYLSCQDVRSNISGVYLISVNNDSSPFKVYCEMEMFGGGWIVLQHRFDGSVGFYRNWTQYRDGFGELDKEFWLGLDRIHQLSSARPHEIIFEMKDFSGNYGYARYDQFKVGSEEEQYNLSIGRYSGTAGDAMGVHQGMKFSTTDRDNDGDSDHCAQRWTSAWWYNDCSDADLNGLYRNVADGKSIIWYSFKNDIRGLSYSRMMIREV